MVWALVRLALSGNQRWWLLAGVFGGLALLSKYTVVLLFPAIVALRWCRPGERPSFPAPIHGSRP